MNLLNLAIKIFNFFTNQDGKGWFSDTLKFVITGGLLTSVYSIYTENENKKAEALKSDEQMVANYTKQVGNELLLNKYYTENSIKHSEIANFVNTQTNSALKNISTDVQRQMLVDFLRKSSIGFASEYLYSLYFPDNVCNRVSIVKNKYFVDFLCNLDLSSGDPNEKTNLKKINLSYAILEKSNLDKTNLEGAILDNTQLDYSTFQDSILIKSSLIEADLHGANMSDADLREANLARAFLRGVKLPSSNLSKAILKGADLNSALLQKADLSYADLSPSTGEYPIRGIPATRRNITSLRNSNLTDVNLVGTKLEKVDLRGADLSNVKLYKSFTKDMIVLKIIRHLFKSPWNVSPCINNNFKNAIFNEHTVLPDEFIEMGIDLYIHSLLIHNHNNSNEKKISAAETIRKVLYEKYDYKKNKINIDFSTPSEGSPSEESVKSIIKQIKNQVAVQFCNMRQIASKADLQNAGLRADVENPDLGVDLQNADLRGFDLSDEDLTGAKLQGANLEQTDLRGTNLSGVTINEWTNFKDAIYSETTKPPKGYMIGAYKIGMFGTKDNKANLAQVNLRNEDLSYSNLSEAILYLADLSYARLIWANFENADLRRVNLTGANLKLTNLKNTKLEKANLIRANLQGADLKGADLSKAFLIGADLRGAKLQQTNLEQLPRLDGAIYDDTTELPFSDERAGGYGMIKISEDTNLKDKVLKGVDLRGAVTLKIDSTTILENALFDERTTLYFVKDNKSWCLDKKRALDKAKKEYGMIYIPSQTETDDELLNLKQANLRGVEFKSGLPNKLNLEGANLRGAYFFPDLNLRGIILKNADLRYTYFNANFSNDAELTADLTNADLRGANLYNTNLNDKDIKVILTGACYNSRTRFPEGFNPKNEGMQEEKPYDRGNPSQNCSTDG